MNNLFKIANLDKKTFFFGQKKKKSNWINNQINDKYVIQSKLDNYRSRAAYKLIEINDQLNIITPNIKNIIDLGCSPGSWSQAVLNISKKINVKPKLLGVDLNPSLFLKGCTFLKGDIFSKETEIFINDFFNEKSLSCFFLDLVLSDLMTNTTGNKDSDHYGSMDLCNQVLRFSNTNLKPNGNLVMKFFSGSEDIILYNNVRKYFKKTYRFKPNASRDKSREMYIIGKQKIFVNSSV